MQRFTFHTDSRQYLVRNNGCAGTTPSTRVTTTRQAAPCGGSGRDFDLSRVCESVIAAECALHLSSQPFFFGNQRVAATSILVAGGLEHPMSAWRD
jgi:hypothetical protein